MYYASSHGYGDSKAFPNLENADGPEKPVKMYECVDYYKKRVRTRLRMEKRRKSDWWKCSFEWC